MAKNDLSIIDFIKFYNNDYCSKDRKYGSIFLLNNYKQPILVRLSKIVTWLDFKKYKDRFTMCTSSNNDQLRFIGQPTNF